MSDRPWRGAAVAAALLLAPAPGLAQAPIPAGPPPPEAAALLRSLVNPSPEPTLRWDWEPDGFDPLAHPIEYDFTWRLRELARADLPEVARARLNFELAFLDDADARRRDPRREGYRPDLPDRPPDPLGRDARLDLAIAGYRALLAARPGHAELLTDLGELFLLAGHADSAVVAFRQAMDAPEPPPRLFAGALEAELARFSRAPGPDGLAAFRDIRAAGLERFAGPAPADSFLAARHLVAHARFRIAQALVDFDADRLARPDAWRYAGIDSVFALLARIVSPPTRRILADAADRDTTSAEAHGLLGMVVTGQILLPVAGRSLLYRDQDVPEDSLALAVWVLARERGEQKLPDLRYAAANLNRCEELEPGRYPVVRSSQARLALLFGDVDGAAGLYRSLMAQFPNDVQHAEELYTVYRVEAAGGGGAGVAPAAERLGSALERSAAETRSGDVMALLGWTRAARKQRAAADSLFRAAAELDSLAWRARLGLAVSALRALDAARAGPHLEAAGEAFARMDDPGKSVYCGAVGLLYWAQHDPENGQRWLREAVVFDPRNGIAAEALRRMNRSGG